MTQELFYHFNYDYFGFMTLYFYVCLFYELLSLLTSRSNNIFLFLDPISNILFCLYVIEKTKSSLIFLYYYIFLLLITFVVHFMVFETKYLSIIQYTLLFTITQFTFSFFINNRMIFCFYLLILNCLRVWQLQFFLWFYNRNMPDNKNIIIYSSTTNIFSDYAHWYLMIGGWTYELRKDEIQSTGVLGKGIESKKHNKHVLPWWKYPYIPFIQYGFVGTTKMSFDKIDEHYSAVLLIDFTQYSSTNKSCQEFCNKLLLKISTDALDTISDIKTTIITIILPLLVISTTIIFYNYEKFYYVITQIIILWNNIEK